MTDAAAPAETAPEWAVIYTLAKPIKAYGEDVSVLNLRRPTGADLIKVGSPVFIYPQTDPPKIDFDFGRVVAMTARLGAVPSSSLETMEAGDLMGLAWELSPFFIMR